MTRTYRYQWLRSDKAQSAPARFRLNRGAGRDGPRHAPSTSGISRRKCCGGMHGRVLSGCKEESGGERLGVRIHAELGMHTIAPGTPNG
jgi:hypothetical protein